MSKTAEGWPREPDLVIAIEEYMYNAIIQCAREDPRVDHKPGAFQAMAKLHSEYGTSSLR